METQQQRQARQQPRLLSASGLQASRHHKMSQGYAAEPAPAQPVGTRPARTWVNGHQRRKLPGAVFVAMRAASIKKVPEPHMGSARAGGRGGRRGRIRRELIKMQDLMGVCNTVEQAVRSDRISRQLTYDLRGDMRACHPHTAPPQRSHRAHYRRSTAPAPSCLHSSLQPDM